MCPACLAAILAAVAGSASGAGALAWFGRQRRLAKRIVEPPSATFQEWVSAILEHEETAQTRSIPALLMKSESRTCPTIERL